MRRARFSVIKKAVIGKGSRVYDQVNLYKCRVGKNTKIDSYVFIAPSVTFTNDKHPRAHGEWTLLKTTVKSFASIGAGSTINPGVNIGENALIGAGSVVTKDIPDNAIAVGIPARVVGYRKPPATPDGSTVRKRK